MLIRQFLVNHFKSRIHFSSAFVGLVATAILLNGCGGFESTQSRKGPGSSRAAPPPGSAITAQKQISVVPQPSFVSVAAAASGNVVWGLTLSGNYTIDTNTFSATANSQGTVIKFDAAGNTLWSKLITSSTSAFVHYTAIDAAENVYIAGDFINQIDLGSGVTLSYPPPTYRYYVGILNSQGVAQTVIPVDGYIRALAVNANGEFAIAGFGITDGTPVSVGNTTLTTPAGSHGRGFVAKFNADRTLAWLRYVGAANQSSLALGLMVAANGDVYGAGISHAGYVNIGDIHSGGSAFVVKMDAATGNETNLQAPTSSVDGLMAVSFSSGNTLVAAGKSILPSTQYGIYFGKWNLTTGNLVSETLMGNSLYWSDRILSVASDPVSGASAILSSYSGAPLVIGSTSLPIPNNRDYGMAQITVDSSGNFVRAKSVSNLNFYCGTLFAHPLSLGTSTPFWLSGLYEGAPSYLLQLAPSN